jgi:hypothetical protein
MEQVLQLTQIQMVELSSASFRSPNCTRRNTA